MDKKLKQSTNEELVQMAINGPDWLRGKIIKEFATRIRLVSYTQADSTRVKDTLMVAMEWGYKAHEKGMNIQQAIIEFQKEVY